MRFIVCNIATNEWDAFIKPGESLLRGHKILWEDKHNERQEHLSHSPLEVLLALRGRGGQVGHRDSDVPLLIEDILMTQGSTGSSQHRANPEHLK